MPLLDTYLRIKPIYPVYRLDERRFRIGAQRKLTIEVEDPHEQLWMLVSALDGTRPLADVVASVCAALPGVTQDDVVAVVRELDAKGLVEDARPTAYESEERLTRYLGNINYFSHYARLATSRGDAQDRLRGARCVLFGLGGGGSYLLPLLLAAGFGEITAVDYDTVERTNLNRQFLFRESDIGTLKSEAAARVAREVNPDVRFTAIQERVESAEQAGRLAKGADVAICAIDEPPFVAQRRVNAGCVAEGVPFVCGGSFVTRGRVFSVRPGETGCLDCLHIHYTRRDPTYLTQLAAGLGVRLDAVPIAFAPHIALVAALMAGEAVRLVTGHAPPMALGTQVDVDYESGQLEPATTWARDAEGCPVCGDGAAADTFDVWHRAEAASSATGPSRG
jgi:molybdopterin-synthase adenylyltransferase